MPLTPFSGKQEPLRELGEPPPLRCLGLPLQGSPKTTLREETFVHCTRTGKESVGDKLGAQSIHLSVCLSVGGGLTRLPSSPKSEAGPPELSFAAPIRAPAAPSRVLLSESKNSGLVSRKLVRRRFEVLLLAEFRMKLQRRFLACKRKPKGL